MKQFYHPVIGMITAGMVALIPGLARAQQAGERGEITRYIDPKQQTLLQFGERSHWLQPYRAYLDTVPARRLREAVGINLNVTPEEADAVCAHLARNGFHYARIEFGWGALTWETPARIRDVKRFDALLGACRRNGLRPLLLLNANSGVPVPMKGYFVRLTQPASKGERVVHLDPATLTQAMPGRSGLSNLTGYCAAEAIFTRIAPDGTVQLSKPLPKDLPVGNAPAATLKYLPFYPSRRKSDNAVPPEFEETMQGWLEYARVIGENAKRALGTEGKPDAGFDFDVWNELTFGSRFLNINDYYEKPLVEGKWAIDEILRRTVAFVRDPENGLPGVGLNDGFDNQWPWGAGSAAPPGLTALGKHPYAGARRIAPGLTAPGKSLDALGGPNAVAVGPPGSGRWSELFTPTYVSHFPEYWLTAIQTEHLIRDLSPITTEIGKIAHGRNTHPDNAPPPTMWVSEVNFDVSGADPGDERAFALRKVNTAFSPEDAEHLRAKAILRYLTAYVNKGVGRFYFYAAKDENPLGLGLMRPRFFQTLKATQNAPIANEDALTSDTMTAVRRLTQAMRGDFPARQARALSLVKIVELQTRLQFAGDPASADQTPNPRPPLTNRDVLGFFPYQAGANKFVVPVYVMTRNLARVYAQGEAETGPARFDMPDETFQLTIGGVSGPKATVSLYDPLANRDIPARVLSRSANAVTIELPLTDSPRLLTLDDTQRAARKHQKTTKPQHIRSKRARKK